MSGSGYGSGSGSGYGYGYGSGDGTKITAIAGYDVIRVDTPLGTYLRVGCEIGSVEWWSEQWEVVAEKHGECVSEVAALDVMKLATP